MNDLEKKVQRLERKLKAFEQTFKQQNLIAKKYNEALIQLQEKDNFLSTVIESNRNAIIAINQNYIVLVFNKAAEEMFGYSKEEMLHKDSLKNIVPDYLYEKHRNALKKFFETKKPQNLLKKKSVNLEAKKKDGTIFPIHIAFGVSETMDGGVIVVANIEDLTETIKMKKEKDKFYYEATHDSLTNLANRFLFKEYIKDLIQQNRDFVLLYIDLDKFKQINDTLGHNYGDCVLKIVAKRMKNVVRNEDIVARLGGDEFAIILKNVYNKKDIENIVKKILNSIEEKIKVNKHELFISASIGIAIFPKDGNYIEEIIKNADQAMYKAKHSNEYKYFFYDKISIKKG